MTNWDLLLMRSYDRKMFTMFKTGGFSGRQLYAAYVNTESGGEVRRLLRGGVDRARDLTRKALNRR